MLSIKVVILSKVSLDEILEDVDWKNKKIDALFHIAWSVKMVCQI